MLTNSTLTFSWFTRVTTQRLRPHEQEIPKTGLKRGGQVNAHKTLNRKSIQLILHFVRREERFCLAAQEKVDSKNEGEQTGSIFKRSLIPRETRLHHQSR